MSAELHPPKDGIFSTRREQAPAGVIPELAPVVTLADAETLEGERVPSGSEGTVVGIWTDGYAYDVEFATPVIGLATLKADQIRQL